MRLNPDCIRDILLSVEKTTDSDTYFEYDKKNNCHAELQKYTHNEILYHFQQCSMSGLIVGLQKFDCGDYVTIGDLSPSGHEFLANIRKSTIWEGVKGVASEIGANSLSSLAEIARQAVIALIKQHFGIT